MEYSILFIDKTTKQFKTEEEMLKFVVDTKYVNIVMTGKTKYIKIIHGYWAEGTVKTETKK